MCCKLSIQSIESKWNFECDVNLSSGWACHSKLLPVDNETLESGKFENFAKYRNIRALTMRTDDIIIDEIPSNIFETFPNIETIQISIGAKNLSNETFIGAKKLLVLNLERNNLESIDRNDFTLLKTVETLSLSFNKINNIADDAFNEMINLEILSLAGNQLKKITNKTFAGALSLNEIYLKQNQIENIDVESFNISTLKLIDLEGNKLKTIDSKIFKCASGLHALFLDNNLLSDLNIDLPNGLQVFSAVYNPIQNEFKFIRFVEQFVNLESMYISGTTSMITFDDSNDLKFNLKRLDVSYNNLTDNQFLKHLNAFPQLEVLLLEGNQFSMLQGLNETHDTFPNLKTMRIRCNVFECNWLQNQIEKLQFEFNTKFDSCSKPAYTNKDVDGIECV